MATDGSLLRDRLGLSAQMDEWLARVEGSTTDVAPPVLPARAQADDQLARLGLTDEDRREALDARPSESDHPELMRLLHGCHRGLVAGMGGPDAGAEPVVPWTAMPPELGAVGRYFYVWVFLAALPDVRRYHAELGIPDDASWEILADLGLQVAVTRRVLGVGGLRTHNWLTLHFRGMIYSLGRLQFERRRLGTEIPEGLPAEPGAHVLGLHIPETGSMTAAACEDSLARAREFFPRYFPDEHYRLGTCGSWLMDEQLADHLPDDSNIVAFQRRFRLLPDARPGDAAVTEFVFRRVGDGPDFPRSILDELPQRTTLERAIVEHLRAGRHWQVRTGWLEL